MIRCAVANQKGGVGKTATSLCLARFLAGKGKKVLLVDSDSQEAIAHALGFTQPYPSLFNFIVEGHALGECIRTVERDGKKIDVLLSNRQTVRAEGSLVGQTAREFAFVNLFRPVENEYDAIIIDCSPSASVIQSCALVYCENVLVPCEMETLSFWGVASTNELAKTLNQFKETFVKVVGVLPTKVNDRLQITSSIMKSLEDFCKKTDIALLPKVRNDVSVAKAVRQREFLKDYDPKSKALQDYEAAFSVLISNLTNSVKRDLTHASSKG